MRQKLAEFLDRPATRYAIMGVILFNAVILGLETSATVMAEIGWLIVALDIICLSIFVAELAAKLYARGFSFFRSGWNVFDFIVVMISITSLLTNDASPHYAFCYAQTLIVVKSF